MGGTRLAKIPPSLKEKNIGWESGRQKRASHPIPELKESLQLKWHDMEGKWPANNLVPDFEATSKVFPCLPEACRSNTSSAVTISLQMRLSLMRVMTLKLRLLHLLNCQACKQERSMTLQCRRTPYWSLESCWIGRLYHAGTLAMLPPVVPWVPSFLSGSRAHVAGIYGEVPAGLLPGSLMLCHWSWVWGGLLHQGEDQNILIKWWKLPWLRFWVNAKWVHGSFDNNAFCEWSRH